MVMASLSRRATITTVDRNPLGKMLFLHYSGTFFFFFQIVRSHLSMQFHNCHSVNVTVYKQDIKDGFINKNFGSGY